MTAVSGSHARFGYAQAQDPFMQQGIYNSNGNQTILMGGGVDSYTGHQEFSAGEAGASVVQGAFDMVRPLFTLKGLVIAGVTTAACLAFPPLGILLAGVGVIAGGLQAGSNVLEGLGNLMDGNYEGFYQNLRGATTGALTGLLSVFGLRSAIGATNSANIGARTAALDAEMASSTGQAVELSDTFANMVRATEENFGVQQGHVLGRAAQIQAEAAARPTPVNMSNLEASMQALEELHSQPRGIGNLIQGGRYILGRDNVAYVAENGTIATDSNLYSSIWNRGANRFRQVSNNTSGSGATGWDAFVDRVLPRQTVQAPTAPGTPVVRPLNGPSFLNRSRQWLQENPSGASNSAAMMNVFSDSPDEAMGHH